MFIFPTGNVKLLVKAKLRIPGRVHGFYISNLAKLTLKDSISVIGYVGFKRFLIRNLEKSQLDHPHPTGWQKNHQRGILISQRTLSSSLSESQLLFLFVYPIW